MARIHSAEDLAAYAAAIAEVKPRLPPGSMTGQPAAVTLPLEPPAILVAEPWVATDPVAVTVGADGSLEAKWDGSSSKWLEVSIGLMGELVSVAGWWLVVSQGRARQARLHTLYSVLSSKLTARAISSRAWAGRDQDFVANLRVLGGQHSLACCCTGCAWVMFENLPCCCYATMPHTVSVRSSSAYHMLSSWPHAVSCCAGLHVCPAPDTHQPPR